MSILDDVKEMQKEGLPEQDIIKSLRERGVSYREISESLTQSKIKTAVEDPNEPLQEQQDITGTPPQLATPTPTPHQEIPGMQKSMLQPPQTEEPVIEGYESPPTEEYSQEYAPQQDSQQYSPDANYNYPQYESYSSGGMSPDIITEISEQVVSEKLSDLRKHMAKISGFKTAIEAKTESIEERIKRIEKIIDSLQSSVLKKVGDYVNNIDDIKRELIETQKTFTKLVPELKEKAKKHRPAHRKTHHTKKHKKS